MEKSQAFPLVSERTETTEPRKPAYIAYTKKGTVKLTEQDVARLWNMIDRSGGEDACWLWTGASQAAGYGRFKMAGRLWLPHRLVFEIAWGPIPRTDSYHGMVVMHLCDTPACCNPKHLRLGHQSDNVKDMDGKGRRVAVRGEAHSRAKLTPDLVRAIRADPRPQRTIAKDYGICKGAVSDIKLRRNWAHVP